MKIRTDFVTNSSSTSYIYWGFYSGELLDFVKDLVRQGHVYLYHDALAIDQKTFDGMLVSEHQDESQGVTDDLMFFPYSWYPYDPEKSKEKTGFQIEETEFTHYDPLSALMSFINLNDLPLNEAEAIWEKAARLIDDAKAKGQIMHKNGIGSTDAENHCFSERDEYRTRFKIEGDTIVSYRDRDSVTIEHSEGMPFMPVIKQHAFSDMTALRTVDLRAGYKKICEGAFQGCSSLEFAWLGNREKEIADSFSFIRSEYPNCSVIESYTIEKDAFRGCIAMNAVIVDCKNIMSSAFEGCTGLEAVEFAGFNSPRNGKIGSRAFAGCTSLKDVYFPDDPWNGVFSYELRGVCNISPSAFRDCGGLLFHVYKGTYAHRFAMKHGYRFELRPRAPLEYRVYKITGRRSRNAESLYVGDKVIIQITENPYLFAVFNGAGEEVGFISESRLAVRMQITDAIEHVSATVTDIEHLSEIQKEKPNAKTAFMYIRLDLYD